MQSVIEQELIEAAEFEAPREYDERQDYLAALTRAANRAFNRDEAIFNTLTQEAADWFNDSVKSLKDKKDIPEFPDIEVDDETSDDGDSNDDAPKQESKPKAKEKTEPKRRAKGAPPKKLTHPKIDPQQGIDNFEVDKWGIVKGSKNGAAAAMFEKGCRMSDVTHSIGGTYYNLLARMQKQGHTVDKAANGMIKLTHKDA